MYQLIGLLISIISIEGNVLRNPELTAVMPGPDGHLNIYVLPIGQGDGHVIQCPSGDLSIIDLGSSEDLDSGYWKDAEVREFLGTQTNMIRNFLITHNHYDHYSIFPYAFPSPQDVPPNLENIYITCTEADLASILATWINGTAYQSKLRTFNNGGQCGPLGGDCGFLDLCPSDPGVSAKVMAANLGQHCSDGGNKNMDSLVFKVVYGSVSIMFTGDFEDETSDWEEDGPQKWMVDYYGPEMEVTVYKISHHGASNLANKPVTQDAVRPKAIFASANAYYSYGHPRCSILDGFIEYVRTLCYPSETDTQSAFYCGPPLTSHQTQTVYNCGESSTVIRDVAGNNYAIYTNSPTADTMNLLTFKTDGNAWNFAFETTLKPAEKLSDEPKFEV